DGLGPIEMSGRIMVLVRRAQFILLALFSDRFDYPFIGASLRIDDGALRIFQFGFFRDEMNQRARLLANARQKIKNLSVQRQVGLGIERGGADERHFLLRHYGSDLFFSPHNESSRHDENLLVIEKALQVRPRDRRRLSSS